MRSMVDGGQHGDVEPITPQQAVTLYLDHREPEVSKKTLTNHRYRLSSFVDWCAEQEIDNLNELTGRDLHFYRTWRGRQVNKVTLRGELATLRVFLEFVASIDGVKPGIREQVLLPEVKPEDEAKDEQLDQQRALDILGDVEKYEYASRDHVILAVLWHTGIRLGSLRAFDVDDFDRDAMCLDLRHRPETDTPLKNGEAANRSIAIGPYYCDVLADYINRNRHDVTDQYGRQPLITSTQGRLSGTAIRNAVYRMTRPCMIGECPHDRDPVDCEAMEHDTASMCPSSRSPHGIRRGSITAHLRSGTPQRVVEDRMNVSGDVLDQHYDERTEREKMEARRSFLEEME